MKKLFLLLFIFTISFQSNSQTTNLGVPIGWKGKLNADNIPSKVMPGYNQAKIDNEDAINDALKSSPWRFGYKYNVNYSFQNSGIWTTLPSGDRIWQIAIECKEAITINILLKNNITIHYDIAKELKVKKQENIARFLKKTIEQYWNKIESVDIKFDIPALKKDMESKTSLLMSKAFRK